MDEGDVAYQATRVAIAAEQQICAFYAGHRSALAAIPSFDAVRFIPP